jgi:NRPS condensation-like uncharacterized protein
MKQQSTIEKRKSTMHYKVEIWDEIQKACENFNDHNLHAVVRFADTVDVGSLRAAVRESFEIVPMLHSRFVAGMVRSRWESIDGLPLDDGVELIETDPTDEKFDALLERTITRRLDEIRGPLVAVTILRNGGRDTLCVVCSHMVCDGAGFKRYLYLLAELYSAIQAGKKTERNLSFLRRRTDRQVYEQLKLKDFLSFLTKPAFREKTNKALKLGFEPDGILAPHMLVRILGGETFGTLASRAKTRGFTVNDVFLAAYFRVIQRELRPAPSTRIVLPLMVDLRRYLRDRETAGICNLSSTLHCGIEVDVLEDFFDTVKRVHERMGEAKGGYPGLKSFFLLSSILRWMPSGLRRVMIRRNFNFALLGMTNIGIIDGTRLIFSGATVTYAYVNGSMKYPPYFQIAVSTFGGQAAVTVNQYCTESDLAMVGRFLDAYVSELERAAKKTAPTG